MKIDKYNGKAWHMDFDVENRMKTFNEAGTRATAYVYGADLERTLKMNTHMKKLFK